MDYIWHVIYKHVKIRWLRIPPCGIPLRTIAIKDLTPITTACCFLAWRKWLTSNHNLPVIPKLRIFIKRHLCGTELNTLAKSKYAASILLPVSRDSLHLWRTAMSWVMHSAIIFTSPSSIVITKSKVFRLLV